MTRIPVPELPISPYLESCAEILARDGRLLLDAAPGAGKTTLLPWTLLAHPAFQSGTIMLLEPRRLAARAAAERLAGFCGEPVGRTVGLRTRLETRVSGDTRVEVITEGVLIRLLQEDPSLAGIGTLLFDEFHLRNLSGDLGLALAWETRTLFRSDLRIGLLSATLPADTLTAAYGPWPVVTVPGREYPVEVDYHPPRPAGEKPWEGAARLVRDAARRLADGAGTILCFLPGYREIFRTRDLLLRARPEWTNHVMALHGHMPPAEQRNVLNEAHARGLRIILATNVAETSLTIPGVRIVVDLGLERRVRFSPRTGLDHWETRPISRASAEQRKGRAGRTGPGQCLRWWHETERRDAFAPPEIAEADLAPLVLETLAWGTAPEALRWASPPPEPALRRARACLRLLGLLEQEDQITPLGRQAARLALHPRLAVMVLKAQGSEEHGTAALLAAVLESDETGSGTDPDLRDRLSAFMEMQRDRSEAHGPTRRVLADVRRILRSAGLPAGSASGKVRAESVGRLLLPAYPDRVAQRTRQDDPHTARYRLSSGRGALVRGPLAQEPFLVAPDLDGGEENARIRLAAPVTLQDLESGLAGSPEIHWSLNWRGWTPRPRRSVRLGALALSEQSAGTPPEDRIRAAARQRLEEEGLMALPWDAAALRLRSRCRMAAASGCAGAWPDLSDPALLAELEDWLFPFGRWHGGPVFDEKAVRAALGHRLGREGLLRLDREVPDALTLPSGVRRKINYEGNEPVLAVRLQDVFGASDSPRLCGRPLLLDLLNPAGRTLQRTRDLAGFWDRTYPDLRPQLCRRYPKHVWPENPRLPRPSRKPRA